MKRLTRALVITLGLIFAVPLILVANEIRIFVTRSEEQAREKAREEFVRTAERLGISPAEFTGPRRIKTYGSSFGDFTYGFLWMKPSNGDQLVVQVRYFPYDVESWFYSGKEEAKFQLY